MATASASKLVLDWEILSHDGPSLTNHAGCIIGSYFYIHGGVTKYGSTSPSDKLFKLDLSSNTWSEIREAGSPALSHHACVSLQDRYMLLIGGWNGRQRTSTVHAFDTQEQRWLHPRDSGFPEGAGLSSHAACVLSTGDVLIVGREGSLRLQRKHGNVYVLTGNVQGEMTYKKMTNNTSSRSGHSINSIGNVLYIIGGRDDNLIEFHSGFQSHEPVGKLNSSFSELAKQLKPLSKAPSGRKNHVSFAGKGSLIIHGGETFDGRSREPVGEMFLVTTKPHLVFHKLGTSVIARASHVCVSTGDRVIFHGGIAGENMVYSDCYELKGR